MTRQQKMLETVQQFPEAIRLLADKSRTPVLTFLMLLEFLTLADLRDFEELRRLDWEAAHDPAQLRARAIEYQAARELLQRYRPRVWSALQGANMFALGPCSRASVRVALAADRAGKEAKTEPRSWEAAAADMTHSDQREETITWQRD